MEPFVLHQPIGAVAFKVRSPYVEFSVIGIPRILSFEEPWIVFPVFGLRILESLQKLLVSPDAADILEWTAPDTRDEVWVAPVRTRRLDLSDPDSVCPGVSIVIDVGEIRITPQEVEDIKDGLVAALPKFVITPMGALSIPPGVKPPQMAVLPSHRGLKIIVEFLKRRVGIHVHSPGYPGLHIQERYTESNDIPSPDHYTSHAIRFRHTDGKGKAEMPDRA